MKQSDKIFEGVYKSIDELKKVSTYEIQLGVLDDSEQVEGTESEDGRIFNYAALMRVHEHGAKGGIIPPRPVLKISLNRWAKGAEGTYLDEFMDEAQTKLFKGEWTMKDFEKGLDELCNDIQNYTREKIKDKGFPTLRPNALSTILKKSKGGKLSDIPLHDTGALSRHIICRWVKK